MQTVPIVDVAECELVGRVVVLFFSTRKAPSLADISLAALKKGLFITIPYSSVVIFQSAWPFDSIIES